jgi:hypothetical protein
MPALTNEKFIQKSKDKWGEVWGYDKVSYINTETEVQLFCKKHQKWCKQTPHQHLRPNKFLTPCGSCENEKHVKTMMERHGVNNPLNLPSSRAKGKEAAKNSEVARKKTCREKYGTDRACQAPIIRAKIESTTQEHYGVKYSLQHPDVDAKRQETWYKNHGGNPLLNLEIQEKIKQTNIFRRGVDNPFKLPEVQKKIRERWMTLYGVSHPMQIPEIAEKCMLSGFQWKEYIFPSGKVIKVQGNENHMINELISTGISEEDIITGRNNMPYVWYEYEGKSHVYYADAMVKNKIYDAKSPYTLYCDLYKNIAKMNAVLELGFEFEFLVYETDTKGNLIKKLSSEEVMKLLV